MLTIPARTVYIDPEVYSRPNCRARLERMLPHIRCQDIRALQPGDLDAVYRIGARRHGKDDFGDDAVIVFTTFSPDRSSWHYHWRDEAGAHGGACQPALELNLVDGCPFRCAYCGFGRRVILNLDVEQFMDGLDDVFPRHPAQRLYKYSNMTDLPPYEPELDAVAPLVRRFASEPGRYLMLFTKSDNVAFLENLPHNGHTIISWSISCETVGREIEKRTASVSERIAAMRRMQQAGYLVRARLSPVVPVVNWREEYAAMLEALFSQVQPDLVTLELLGWMTVDDLLAILPRDLLEPGALAGAEAARDELRDVTWGPFTQETHELVYRYLIETVQRLSPGTPVSPCHGTPATWRALGGLIGMTPDDYLCNCGPQSAPGGRLYERWHPVISEQQPGR